MNYDIILTIKLLIKTSSHSKSKTPLIAILLTSKNELVTVASLTAIAYLIIKSIQRAVVASHQTCNVCSQ